MSTTTSTAAIRRMFATLSARSVLSRAVLGILAAMMVLVPAAGTAHAEENHALQNYATGRCIDDSAAFGLRTFPCNGMTYQKWNLHWIRGLEYTLQNVATGRCIDWSENRGLRAFPCNGLDYQEWLMGSGDDIWSNRSGQTNLDDSYAFGLRVLPPDNLDDQRWHKR